MTESVTWGRDYTVDYPDLSVKMPFNYQIISPSVLSVSFIFFLPRPTRDSEDDEDDERKGKGCTLQVLFDWFAYHTFKESSLILFFNVSIPESCPATY